MKLSYYFGRSSLNILKVRSAASEHAGQKPMQRIQFSIKDLPGTKNLTLKISFLLFL